MKIAFVDFEAASLKIKAEDHGFTKGSFPIEIGIASLDTDSGEIAVWSSLIRKAAVWDMKVWDPESQAVHGIAPEAILSPSAPEARTVAPEAIAILAQSEVAVLGNELYDGRWFGMLAKAASLSPYAQKFESLEGLGMKGVITLDQYLGMGLPEGEPDHRAGADARRMAEAFLAGWGTETPRPGM